MALRDIEPILLPSVAARLLLVLTAMAWVHWSPWPWGWNKTETRQMPWSLLFWEPLLPITSRLHRCKSLFKVQTFKHADLGNFCLLPLLLLWRSSSENPYSTIWGGSVSLICANSWAVPSYNGMFRMNWRMFCFSLDCYTLGDIFLCLSSCDC